MILKIATFLDPFSQLKLSQVNKKVRSYIEENFWPKQIQQKRYYVWNSSLPKAQVFFANYFYYYGFNRDPMLPERVVVKIEDITLLPNIIYAERALALGFPKGHIHYKQAQHKERMLKVDKKISQGYREPSYELSAMSNKFSY